MTEQRDGVSLDEPTPAGRSRRVVDLEPQERHAPDVFADALLQIGFFTLHRRAVNMEPPSGAARAPADSPARRQRCIPTASQRRPNYPAEDRTAMVATPRAGGAPVLGEPVPQRGSRSGLQSMCADPHYPIAGTGAASLLPTLEENVDATPQPRHSSVASLEARKPPARSLIRESRDIEANGVRDTV